MANALAFVCAGLAEMAETDRQCILFMANELDVDVSLSNRSWLNRAWHPVPSATVTFTPKMRLAYVVAP